MIREWIFYLCNQGLLSLILLPVFVLFAYAIKRSQVSDWRSDLWTFYFVIILIPFQKMGEWVSSHQIQNVQWVKLQTNNLESKNTFINTPSGFDLSWVDVIFALWFLGAMMSFLTFVILPFIRERHWIKKLEPSKAREENFINFPKKTFLTDQPVMPFVFGLFSPQVVISTKLYDHLSSPEVESVLHHEKAHQIFLDPLRLFFARVVTSIFWFNPFLLWAGALLLNAIELRADQYAFSEQKNLKKSDYAKTLMNMITIQTKHHWSHLGLGIISKHQMIERISAMKHSKTRRKPNVFMPLIILFVLLPFSFSVGGLTGGETSKKGGDFVTLIAKVYHKGQVVARPTMISKFGEASQIVMGDSDDRGTWFLEVTVEPDGDYLRARGKVCFTINKFEPGKIPDCKNDNHFEFAQKPEVPLTLKTPENPYTYEFVLHKGAKTKKFLRHLDVHDGENWMVKKIVVEE